MTLEDKETKFDQDFLREDKEEHEEANDVEKREEEMSFVSDTVKRQAEEKFNDCKCMSNKSEAKKCKNDEIIKREPSKLIAEVKRKDSEQKNERKMKRNDGERDDYDKKAKICDDGHEGDKPMQVNDEMTDVNDTFLDSGQVNNEVEDSESGFRREVEETIENDVETEMVELELEKHENEKEYKFGREIEQERPETMNETIDYEEEKKDSKRIMEKDKELTEICNFEVGNKNGNCKTYEKAQKLRMDVGKVPLSVCCVIFAKLIAMTKEMMRRHDVMPFEEDDD